jgi:hypothetical protein
MRGLLIGFAILSGVMIVQGYARTEQITGGSYLARVDRVFVEVDTGVYLPAEAATRLPGMPQWVHVSFPEPLEDGRTSATAKVQTDLSVERDDLVMLRLVGTGFPRAEPVYNEISAVLSKPQIWIP